MTKTGKLRREVMRAFHQLWDALTPPFERLSTRRWDRRFPQMLTVTPGAMPPGDKLALYVLFQPAGISASTLAACDHLRRQGYAPVLVSNAPLSSADREQLARRAATVLERPNRGLDFGAYRDGLRWIDEVAGWDPACLLMLNDSIWFPLRDDETLIARLEATEQDFAGAMYELKGNRLHRAHYQSYFLLLRRPALKSAAFRDFWRRYLLSDTRRNVLRRGEIGLSQAMFTAGFAPAFAASQRDFLAAIDRADADFLHQTLRYAAYDDRADLEQEAQALLAQDRHASDWCERARAHVRRGCGSGGYQLTFRPAVEQLFDLPFLKKKRRGLEEDMRRQYLRAIAAGDLPPLRPDVAAELQNATG